MRSVSFRILWPVICFYRLFDVSYILHQVDKVYLYIIDLFIHPRKVFGVRTISTAAVESSDSVQFPHCRPRRSIVFWLWDLW